VRREHNLMVGPQKFRHAPLVFTFVKLRVAESDRKGIETIAGEISDDGAMVTNPSPLDSAHRHIRAQSNFVASISSSRNSSVPLRFSPGARSQSPRKKTPVLSDPRRLGPTGSGRGHLENVAEYGAGDSAVQKVKIWRYRISAAPGGQPTRPDFRSEHQDIADCV
jgi:hypothetical protein